MNKKTKKIGGSKGARGAKANTLSSILSFLKERKKVVGASLATLVVLVVIGAIFVFASNPPVITAIDGKAIIGGQVDGSVSSTPTIAGTANSNSLVSLYNQSAPTVKEISLIGGGGIVAPEFTPGESGGNITDFAENFDDSYYQNGWSSTNAGGVLQNGLFQISSFNSGISRSFDMNINTQPGFSIEGDFTAPQQYGQMIFDFGIQNNFGPPHKSLKILWGEGSYQSGIMIAQNSDMSTDSPIGDSSASVLVSDDQYPKMVVGQTYKVRLEYDGNTTARAYVNGSLVLTANNVAPLTDYYSQIEGGNIRKEIVVGIRAGNSSINPVLSIDNIVTDFKVSNGFSTPDSYLLAKQGFSIDGVDYNSPAPIFGDGVDGIISFASNGPAPLPTSITSDDFRNLFGNSEITPDIYAYLTKVHIDPGVMGNDSAMDMNWTIYDIKSPYQFANMVMSTLPGGITMTVEGYTKVFIADSATKTYGIAPAPLTSLGTIGSNGEVTGNEGVPVLIARAMSDSSGNWTATFGKDENGAEILAGTLRDIGDAPYNIFAEVENGQVSLADGSPELELSKNSTGASIFADGFDDANWEDLWDYSNNLPDQGNGELLLNGSNVAVESRANFETPQSFFVQADLSAASAPPSATINWNYNYDIGIQAGFGPSQSLKLELSNDQYGSGGTVRILQGQDNSMCGDSGVIASASYPVMNYDQSYTLKLTYDINSNIAVGYVNGEQVVSAQVNPITYSYKVMVGIRACSDGMSQLSIDNLNTNLPVVAPESYSLSATGLSYGGVDYTDPAPMFGDPNAQGILLWTPDRDGPVLIQPDLPISSELVSSGLYAYLTHLDIPAGVVGPDPAVFNWTIYSGSPTEFYGGVLSMFSSMGIDASVDAFIKIDINISGTISAITLPAISQGSITSNGQMLAREKSSTVIISEISDSAPSGDSDGDGIDDNDDNCPYIQNAEQEDIDQNRIGDLCETSQLDDYIGSTPALTQLAGSSENNDLDGDRILNWEDICPLDPENLCISSQGQRYLDSNTANQVKTGNQANTIDFNSSAFLEDTIAWIGVSAPYELIPGATPARVAEAKLTIDARGLSSNSSAQGVMAYDSRFPASAYIVYQYDKSNNSYTPIQSSCVAGKCTFPINDISKEYVLGQSCVFPNVDPANVQPLDQNYNIVDTFDQPTMFCPGTYRLPEGASWLTNTSTVNAAYSNVYTGGDAPAFIVGSQPIPNATANYGITHIYVFNATNGVVTYKDGPLKKVSFSGVHFINSKNGLILNSDVKGGTIHSCRFTNVENGITANGLVADADQLTIDYNVFVSGKNFIVGNTATSGLNILANNIYKADNSLLDMSSSQGVNSIRKNMVWDVGTGIINGSQSDIIASNDWMYSANGFVPGNFSKDFAYQNEGNFWSRYQPPFFKSELADPAGTGTKTDSKAYMFQRQWNSELASATLKAGYASAQSILSSSQSFALTFPSLSISGTYPADNQNVYIYGTPSYFINAIPHSPLYAIKTFKDLGLQKEAKATVKIPKVSAETVSNLSIYRYNGDTGVLTPIASACTRDVCTAQVGTDLSGYFVVAEMFPESQADKTPPEVTTNVNDTATKLTITVTVSDGSQIAGVFYCIGADCIPDKEGDVIEITEPGDHTVRIVAVDESGNASPIEEIVATHVVDSDGDGTPDGSDSCPNVSGTANYGGCPFAIDVDSQILVNYIGKTKFTKKLPVKVGPFNDPMNEEITGVEAKVYKTSDLGSAYGNIQQNCGTYYDGNTAQLSTRSMPLGTELIGVPEKGSYVVMQRVAVYEPASNTTGIVTTCRNVELKDFTSNVVKKEMPIIKSVKDGKVTLSGGQTTVMTGSMLEIVYPENVLWQEGITEYIYTYIFTSDSDWNVDVCTYTPEGYKVAGVYDDNGELVANGNCTQAFVANETKVIAFEVVDIGSPKIFDVDLKITGKRGGKQQKLDTKIHTKIVSKDNIEKKGKITVGEKVKDGSKKVISEDSVKVSDKPKKSIFAKIADFIKGIFN